MRMVIRIFYEVHNFRFTDLRTINFKNNCNSTKGCKMKKLFVIAALTLASGSAFASKARMEALGNAAYLIDTQTLFTNPGDINYTNDFATLEFGGHSEPTYTYAAATGTTITG